MHQQQHYTLFKIKKAVNPPPLNDFEHRIGSHAKFLSQYVYLFCSDPHPVVDESSVIRASIKILSIYLNKNISTLSQSLELAKQKDFS